MTVPALPEPQALSAGSIAWSFLAGLSGAAIPLGVMWVKLRLDQLSARCDAFAKVVEQATDLALEYWLMGVPHGDVAPPQPDTDDGRKRDAALLRSEIKLRGAQLTLQADVQRMSRDLPACFRDPLRLEFTSAIDALTGGRFGDRDGHTEPHKARAAVSSGARIIRIVREGRDAVSQPWHMLRYMLGRS